MNHKFLYGLCALGLTFSTMHGAEENVNFLHNGTGISVVHEHRILHAEPNLFPAFSIEKLADQDIIHLSRNGQKLSIRKQTQNGQPLHYIISSLRDVMIFLPEFLYDALYVYMIKFAPIPVEGEHFGFGVMLYDSEEHLFSVWLEASGNSPSGKTEEWSAKHCGITL